MSLFVENVLEVLGNRNIAPVSGTPIRLSRIDLKAVDGLCRHLGTLGLTEKQRGLVLHLIQKYRRQLGAAGIDIAPVVENPQWRTKVRVLEPFEDRMWVEDNLIKIKFNYNNKLIDRLHNLADAGNSLFLGELEYLGKGSKTWNLGIGAEGINLAYRVYKEYKFTIDEQLRTMFEQVDALVQQQKHSYVSWDNGWQFHNAAKSQQEYAEKVLSEVTDFSHQLIDLIYLGFDVDDSVKLKLLETWTPKESSILIHRTFFIESKQFTASSLADFLDQLNMWPVVINYGWYQEFDQKVLKHLIKAFGAEQIYVLPEKNTGQDWQIPEDKKIVVTKYNNFIPKGVDVPLLITYTGLMGKHSNRFSASPYFYKKVLHIEPEL